MKPQNTTPNQFYLDTSGLAQIIARVNEILSERGRDLDPIQRARLIAIIYERWVRDDKKINDRLFDRYLKLVC